VGDRATEAFFMDLYGSPFLQAMLGLRSDWATARRRIGRDVVREAAAAKCIAELGAQMEQGGLVEAALRAVLYVGLGRPRFGPDERGFAALQQIRAQAPAASRLSLARLKELMRQQYLLLQIDEERALAAIPKLLPADASERSRIFDNVRSVVTAPGSLPPEAERRFARIEALFKSFIDADRRPTARKLRSIAGAGGA